MTGTERRWKWVKKESLPADLVALMDIISKKGKKKKDKEDDDDEDKKRDTDNVAKEIKEEAMT